MPSSFSLPVTSNPVHKQIKLLSKCDVSEFITETTLVDENQFMAIAKERHDAGQKDLFRICIEKRQRTEISPKDNIKNTYCC